MEEAPAGSCFDPEGSYGGSWRVLEGPDNLSQLAVLASILEGERFFYKTKNVVGGSQRMYLRAYGAWRVLKGPGGS